MSTPVITADWLRAPATQAVFAALGVTAEVRIVGGAVRNALMGQAIADIDFATTAQPEATRQAAHAAGLTTIDTGLAHGTVTVVSAGNPYEVTTLRRDAATDGRHAVVVFTTDWTADASRRDFTLNALYCDADGRVYDPLGGLADLTAGRVRFIGTADARIAEDYLRILRFFRFSAAYGRGDLDAAGLAACGRGRKGLRRLSAERVRSELLKLLMAPRAVEVAAVMHDHGYWPGLLGLVPAPTHLQAVVALTEEPLTRLAALAVNTPEQAGALAERLRLANVERRLLSRATGMAPALREPPTRPLLRQLLYRHGRPAVTAAVILAHARWGRELEREIGWTDQQTLLTSWPIPHLPISGADLMAAGLSPGPAIGQRLARAESAWIDADFALARDALLAIALA